MGFSIENRKIAVEQPTYFIADIGANHDGDLSRAKDLIYLAAESGAEAAKFQHFSAETIVSKVGFSKFDKQLSHQENWDKSVDEVYRDASINLDWTLELKQCAIDAGIHFFTSPYSFEMVDHVLPYVDAIKIGSGDITWLELIEYLSKKNKACILATGASSLQEVADALNILSQSTDRIALLQCNTNYSGSSDNFKYANLNVLKTFKRKFPNVVLGLSDHTSGHAAVLGAIALDGRIIEKHFTDDKSRNGPDHNFALDPSNWREMVDRSRELEDALGDGIKRVEENELETVIVQRRGIYSATSIGKGEILGSKNTIALRPCLERMVAANQVNQIYGKRLCRSIKSGEPINWEDIES